MVATCCVLFALVFPSVVDALRVNVPRAGAQNFSEVIAKAEEVLTKDCGPACVAILSDFEHMVRKETVQDKPLQIGFALESLANSTVKKLYDAQRHVALFQSKFTSELKTTSGKESLYSSDTACAWP